VTSLSGYVLIGSGAVVFALYFAACRVLRFELLPITLRRIHEFWIYWLLGFLAFGLLMHWTSTDPWIGAGLYVSPFCALCAMAINESPPKRP